MIASAQRALEAADGEFAPTLEDVRTAIALDPERYKAPARVRFRQVFLSFQARGDRIDADAASIVARLARAPAGVEALSDPWPWSSPGGWQSTERLGATMGDGFGEALATAPLGRYTGPIRSSFGLHFVIVDEREDAHVPPADAVRARVTEDLARARREARRSERIAALREGYAVTIARSR